MDFNLIKQICDLKFVSEDDKVYSIISHITEHHDAGKILGAILDTERSEAKKLRQSLRLALQEGVHGVNLDLVKKYPTMFAEMFCVYFPKGTSDGASKLGVAFYDTFVKTWNEYIKTHKWESWAKNRGLYDTIKLIVK